MIKSFKISASEYVFTYNAFQTNDMVMSKSVEGQKIMLLKASNKKNIIHVCSFVLDNQKNIIVRLGDAVYYNPHSFRIDNTTFTIKMNIIGWTITSFDFLESCVYHIDHGISHEACIGSFKYEDDSLSIVKVYTSKTNFVTFKNVGHGVFEIFDSQDETFGSISAPFEIVKQGYTFEVQNYGKEYAICTQISDTFSCDFTLSKN